MSMTSFSRVGMTGDPKLAAAYLVMAKSKGLKDDEPFHVIHNEAAPSKAGLAVFDEYAKQGIDPVETLPSQIKFMDIQTLKNGKDGTLYSESGRFTHAMTIGDIEKNLDKYMSDRKSFDRAFDRSPGSSQRMRNEAIDIIRSLLTSENESFWFDAYNSLDMAFGGKNRLKPADGFGFFSDSALAANSRFSGAGQVQGTSNSSIAEQKQELAIRELAIRTRAIKLAPDAKGSMNGYISSIISAGGRQMVSAQAATKSVVEKETYQSILDTTTESVSNNLFSAILPGVNSPADLNGQNIFEWIQNFGLFLKLFSTDGGNARAKDLIIPIEDYWIITSTLVAAFSSGAASNMGFAITPLEYLENQLGVNVYPTNALGNGADQVKSWMISSEAMHEPNAKPTYGMLYVDEGSLYYGFSGLNFTIPQTAPVNAMRYSEIAYYRRKAWATLSWT